MNNQPMGPKDPEEIKTLSFDFVRELSGATIATVVSAVPSVYKGVDPNPEAVKVGLPAISGTKVLQKMGGGLAGVGYKWRVTVQDSAGNVHVETDWVLVENQ